MQSLGPEHTLLLLDASSQTVQVGITRDCKWLSFYRSGDESLDAIFDGVDKCLQQADVQLPAIDGFLFCEGPGSILGIRLAAMAIRSWRSLPEWHDRPVFSYKSLEIAGKLLQLQDASPPFHIITDYRKNIWNHISVSGSGEFSQITRFPSDEIEKLEEPLFYLKQRKNWQSPPQRAQSKTYDLTKLPELLDEADCFIQSDEPEAFTHGEARFVKWSQQRHR